MGLRKKISYRALVMGALTGMVINSSVLADHPVIIPTLEEAAKVNDHTIGVVFTHEELFHQLVHNMESVLEPAGNLRIVPIMGKNHVQSIYDLLYLHGIDLALVRADAVEYVKRNGNLPNIRNIVRNVVKVSDEKVVIIANEEYKNIDDLLGLDIGFGLPGSGEYVTGSIALDLLGVYPEHIHVDNREAIEKVKSGELAAMVYLLRAPDAIEIGADLATAELVQALSEADGVHVLPLPDNEEMTAIYESAKLTHDDMPNLIAEGEEIDTYSVDAILAAYNWQGDHKRFSKMSRFVNTFVDHVAELQTDEFQPVWQRVDFTNINPSVTTLSLVGNIIAERERAELEAKIAEEKRVAEEEAAAKAAKIEKLTKQRDEIIALLGKKIDNADTAEMERLLGELNSFLESLETVPAESADAGTTAANAESGG